LVVEKILSSQPQLIVMDYHARATDSMKVFSTIKQSRHASRIPVIFMGKDLTEKEKVLLLKMGAHDVMSRPCTAGEFLARAKKALGEEI
jgi:DNA-binding response OmpR family regulator